MAEINPFDFFVEPLAETSPFAYPAEFAEELAPYLDVEPAGPRLAGFLASIHLNRKNTVYLLVELIYRLQSEHRTLVRIVTCEHPPQLIHADTYDYLNRLSYSLL